MRKIFTLLALLLMAVSAKATDHPSNPYYPKGDEPVVGQIQFLHNPDKKKAPTLSGSDLGAPNGWSIECTVDGKNVESGNSITIDGTNYITMKFNNGGLHIVTLPEGYVANAVWIYSVTNVDAADRPCYWAEVDGVTYKKPDFDYLNSYKDFNDPAISYFKLSGGNSFTLKNAGEQQLVVLKIDYTAPGEDPDPVVPEVPELASHYDFTAWSEATIAALKADTAAWSDIEKADGTEPTETSKDNCFWMVGSNVAVGANGNLYANGTIIEELKGLDFTTAPATRNLAIAVNYPEALSVYHGGAYLWLGGSGKDYFVMHGVKPGSEITMGVESHKTSDARGVELYVYANGAKGDKLVGTDGNAVAVPKEYTEQTWAVPAGEAPVDIMVYNTNGCHLYFIDIVEGEGSEDGDDDDDPVVPGPGEGGTTTVTSTIFHWQYDGNQNSKKQGTVDDISTVVGGTLTYQGTGNTNTESIKDYNENVPEDSDMRANGGYGIRCASGIYLQIDLENGLKKGDVISICGYKDHKIGTSVTSNKSNGEIATLTAGNDNKDYKIVSHTIETEDFDGVKTLYFSYNNNAAGICAIKIERKSMSLIAPVHSNAGLNAKDWGIEVKAHKDHILYYKVEVTGGSSNNGVETAFSAPAGYNAFHEGIQKEETTVTDQTATYTFDYHKLLSERGIQPVGDETLPSLNEGQKLQLTVFAADPNTELMSEPLNITADYTGDTSGIVEVVVDNSNAPVEFFNLQGVRVDNPANGIFIRRQGNNVSKVVIR